MRVRIALLALFLLPWVTAAQEIDGREGDSQNHLVWHESGTEDRSGQAPDINTSLNEYRPRAHFEDAVSLMKMGKAEEAALGFRKAITQGSKDQLAYLYLGRMAYKLHRYSEAIWAIGESVRLHPRDTELLTGNDWIRLISSHGVLAHYSAAYKTCEEARRHLTDDKDLQGIHVLYAYGAEDWEAAERVHRSYRTGSAMPSLTGRLFELGEIAVKAGANYAALKHYSASYSFYEPIFGPSNCRHRRVLMDKVISIYQALPLKPQPPAVAISATLQAQKHIERKEWSKAAWSYKDAISLAPWWPDAHFNLAMLWGADYWMIPGALQEMELFLRLSPQSPLAARARQSMSEWNNSLREARRSGAGVHPDDCIPTMIQPDREDF